jgi:hypothetical protein
VHDRAEDSRARPTGTRSRRRWLAAYALILGAAPAYAEPAAEVTRPAVSHLGWTLDFTGFVQADAVVYSQASDDQLDPATSEPLAEEHFGIPRAALRVDAHKGPLAGELELEAFTTRATLPEPTQTSGVRLETAMVSWRDHPYVEVDGGLFRIPFGVGTSTNPRDRLFMELPTFERALFPGDIDAGVMAKGAYGILRYSLAVMNGAPVGDAQWKGKDPSASYDFVGRIGGDWGTRAMWGHPHVTFGVSGLAGRALHPGTPPTKDHIQWVDDNHDGMIQTTELQVIAGTPGEPSVGFDHSGLGVDASFSWCLQWAGRGNAFFEGAIATDLDRGLYYADPIANSRKLRELGYQIGATQHLGPHALAGIRYDRYDADRDAAEQDGTMLVGVHRVFSTWAFLAAALWGNTKLSFEYDHARNPLGRDDSGAPATRGDDRAMFRAQAEF